MLLCRHLHTELSPASPRVPARCSSFFALDSQPSVFPVRAANRLANGGKGEITQKLDEAFDAFMEDYVARRLAARTGRGEG